ncbi:Hsp70 family protein [Glycomyces terrestris]|uniref:Tetratricopeptide repeat protein n=1 Tax=Glycomyces terrestris TaxID=2493553 RepID=A0A426UWS0_9ACTN|nr:Hsp70 family protein [Glycomyces terrestris]RRR98651.1 hypothetical protein EIW28_17470 [Glycomyces terrestris]
MSADRFVDLGIDLGGTGIRAAYGVRGEARGFTGLEGARWPWLGYEPPRDPGGTAAFPTWKSRLGTAGAGDDPEAVFARALGDLRDRVAEAAAAPVRRTVIAVPARFETRQREALLRAAAAAGLDDAGLLGDSLAAAGGRPADAPAGLLLAFGMGYTGFELALIDASGPRCRALGYDGETSGGGADLDALVARWYLDTRGEDARPPAGEAAWRRLRQAAEDIKRALAAGDTRIALPDIGRRLDADRAAVDAFGRLAAGLVTTAMARADALVDELGGGWDRIRGVLLYGGSAALAADAAASRGVPVTRASARALALGALRHAALDPGPGAGRTAASATGRTGTATGRTTPLRTVPDLPSAADRSGNPAAGRTGNPAATGRTASDQPPAAGRPGNPAGTGRTGSPSASGSAVPDPPSAGLDAAADLIAAGRTDEAEAALTDLIAAAERMLADLRADRAAASRRSRAALLLEAAGKHLAAGRPEEALSIAHRAWARGGDDPDLLDAMIQVHVDAAMEHPTADDYERQHAWLTCAYHHDLGNPRLLDLLAERAYLHAGDLRRLGRISAAREVLRQALAYNPDHRGAADLLRRLDRLP